MADTCASAKGEMCEHMPSHAISMAHFQTAYGHGRGVGDPCTKEMARKSSLFETGGNGEDNLQIKLDLGCLGC